MQVDLTRPPTSSQPLASQSNQTSLSQQMQMNGDCTSGGPEEDLTGPLNAQSQVAQAPRIPLEFLDDDPALSQYTGSTQILESLTQRARRFADITGSERLTRFFSTWSTDDLLARLVQALQELQLSIRVVEEGGTAAVVRVKALDTTGCPLIGSFGLYTLHNGMTVAEFNKKKGDPQQWRRLFKLIAYQVREAIYTG